MGSALWHTVGMAHQTEDARLPVGGEDDPSALDVLERPIAVADDGLQALAVAFSQNDADVSRSSG
jgi:hypothetical protein